MAWNRIGNFAALTLAFVFAACGDDVTNENITQIVQENMVVVADISKLPDCTTENEGQQALVKGEPSLRICVDGKWFATFSDYTDKLDDFKCSAEKMKDGSGLKILCNGDSIGVVLNGSNGSNGKNGSQGIQGEQGDKGLDGANGKSAYEIAKAGGYKGSESEWLESLKGANGVNGKSAYEIAKDGGYTGTEAEWLESLKGANGTNGTNGVNGKSAYEIAKDGGYTGTEAEWLESLKGANGTNGTNGVNGKSAYEIAKDGGYTGTEAEWLESLKGANGTNGTNGVNGKSAYEIAKDGGYTGTEAEWLESLKGANGTNGTNGVNGKSAYEIAKAGGYKGTETEWLASLKGEKGDSGEGCSIERNGSLITITCGNQNAIINLNEIIANSNLGTCSSVNENEISQYENTYYICRSNMWVEASVLEYDTYGKTCSEDGSIVDGEVIAENKYTCDAGTFREAYDMEISLGKACGSYTKGEEIRIQITDILDSVYECSFGSWFGYTEKRVFGTLLDERDQKTYKTVVIGGQTWMAEDLDYADSINYPSMLERNWCYTLYSTSNKCEGPGRLYTWAAAMDSMGTFSNNGKGCGDGWICSPTYPVRGICPEGWHLPDTTEWKNLFLDVGGKSIAGKMLKTVSGWENDGNGTDEYGFSAWPSGKRENVYSGSFSSRWKEAIFWTSTSNRRVSRGNGLCTWFLYNADCAYMDLCVKHYGYSVRCVKDR